ncbi:MAG TPA: NAD(P)H-dependent oxidoreductase, partial [Dehalococcoidia bacterium]|nr:NAD(P)H-dependent oxidoreductase [Dehalococcoidia bacterium]
FLKAALMGAEELGVESEIIRVMDLKVLPCNSCHACQKTGKCAKDDVDWILEKTMLGDAGVIVSAPVYHVRTNGYLICISEKTNHLFRRDPHLFERRRMGAIISVGGSGYDGWTSLGLPTINLFTQHFSTLVDQIQINHCADKGAALTPDNEWAIDRCKKLGRNMAKALSMPPEKVKYVGEDTPVSCPVCHCNIMYFEKDFPEIACPVCQVHGTVSVAGGKFKIAWNRDDIRSPRFSTEKEHHHMEWIARHRSEETPQIALPETQKKIKKYNAYGKFIKPEK